MSATAQLQGTVRANSYAALWSKVSGPGTVTFAPSATVLNPVATLSAVGTYVIRLSVTANGFTRTDDLTVVVQENVAPVITAGADADAITDEEFLLQGSVSDDGLPAPGAVALSWTKVSGPGDVEFVAPNSPITVVTFDAAGSYTLRLTGDDGEIAVSDDVVITVTDPPPPPVPPGGGGGGGGGPIPGAVYATATARPTPPGRIDPIAFTGPLLEQLSGDVLAGNASLTDVEFMVDLSRMPAGWWSAVSSTGADIRVRTNTDAELPMDLVTFSKTNQTGFLVFKSSASGANTPVRIYAGLAGAVAPAVDSTFGQYNAYGPLTIGFWPTGRGSDRTRNQLALTETGAITNVTGPLGVTAAVYGAAIYSSVQLPSGGGSDLTVNQLKPVILSAVSNASPGADLPLIGVVRTNGGAIDAVNSAVSLLAAVGPNAKFLETDEAGASGTAASQATNVRTWRFYAGGTATTAGAGRLPRAVCRALASHETEPYLPFTWDAGGPALNSPVNTTTASPMLTADRVVFAATPRLTPVAGFHNGPIALARMSATALSATHHNQLIGSETGVGTDVINFYTGQLAVIAAGWDLTYRESMMDQDSFWGQWQLVQVA